tara:strand:- start:162 stop:317 length:156 start_codon:yes stop_codon:yes gene_type:complete
MDPEAVAQVVDLVLIMVLVEQEMMVDLLDLVPKVALKLLGTITLLRLHSLL